jgi:tRNA(adenine34) deaminase
VAKSGYVAQNTAFGEASGDERWMREALAEADLAPAHGDVPVGCVILGADGLELARDHNRREDRADPTAHAELLALRAASAKLGHWRLEGATVFVTLEPCPMCAGALVNARVRRVVFGASDAKAGALVSLFEIGRDVRLNHRFEVVPGVLAVDGAARLKAFFARLRAAGNPTLDNAQGDSSVGVSVPSSGVGALAGGGPPPESAT